MLQAWRSARGPMLPWLLPFGLLFSVQGWAGEIGKVTMPTPATTCSPGGSSSASNCSSWFGSVLTLPGTVCTMNVGNNNLYAKYTNKIRNCGEARQRLEGIDDLQCDVINIIELNSAAQCKCACDPNNTCTVVTNYDGTRDCIDNPLRDPECAKPGFGYYEPERCELCQGCGAEEPVSCEAQARILCDSAFYEEPYCHEVSNKGCDCMCVRKGPCVPPPEACDQEVITGPPGCDSGNYAICRKCDYDNDKTFDWASCVAHPSHCMDAIDDEGGIQGCLETCNTPILEEAAEYIADAEIRTISGDFNCDPDGCVWFGVCPWVDRMRELGLTVCDHSRGTSIFGCEVDLVLSNSCGCASQENRDPSPGDHFTIAFNTNAREWSGGEYVHVLSAESASSCPDPDQRSSTSDQLGRRASCPTTENGKPVGSCSSWGHLNGEVAYHAPANDCIQPIKVLVCETATAQAAATCTANASSGSSAFLTFGKAQSSQGATCVNGTPYNPAPRIVTTADFVVPSQIKLGDGNYYFWLERDVSRDHGAECSAALRQGTCATPVNPLASAPLVVEPCPAVPIPME